MDDVDFVVGRAEVHCLIGANGAGKSTLMKVLSGVYSADAGTISLDGTPLRMTSPRDGLNAGIAVIYQELSLVEHLTVAENIFMGQYPCRIPGVVDWGAMFERAQALLDGLGVPISPHRTVAGLSMGHKQIVELCKAMAANARVVVMDEPSATLSEEEFKALVRVVFDLKAQGVTIIYISHRLEELFLVGDSVTVLRDGKKAHDGPIQDLDVKGLVRLMIGHDVRSGQACALPQPEKTDKVTARCLSNAVLKGVDFSVKHGEILGLYGLVGSGRSEILHSLFGSMRHAGKIEIDGRPADLASPVDGMRLGVGLIPEQRKTQGLIVGLPVWENASMAANPDLSVHGILFFRKIFALVRDYAKRLRIKTPDITTEVRNLSGGNQQKVVIAKWLMKQSKILLFDEPTQGIDVGAKEEVYDIIRGFAGVHGTATIVASSELEELECMCHRILVLYEGRIVAEFAPPFPTKHILHTAITGEGHESR
ncbi:sugar ABC transporter ATP-binding protein [Desulfovibrio inopinatus]|uniref:sugar ABC transporter ATP-binding protein n=1 Tax=Desulfovibrio inopinatus TaxID=102109 RepID=UPI00146FBE04|nr:sugar ABC transporter ATP-binding protein [Desulfovibrio inopinatus]